MGRSCFRAEVRYGEAADMITQDAVAAPLRTANKVSNRGIMIKLQVSIADPALWPALREP
jgi:hypothetical protein